MKHILVGCVLFGVISLVMSMAIGYAFTGGSTALYMTPAFKAPTAPEMQLMWVVPFLTGAMFAVIYSLARQAVPGKGAGKGLAYGFLMWIFGSVTGMLMTWTSFAVADLLVLDWLVAGLATYLVSGILLEVVFQKL
jgi:hypothetical protein